MISIEEQEKEGIDWAEIFGHSVRFMILVCDILAALAKLSENKLDDAAVAKIREMLLEDK